MLTASLSFQMLSGWTLANKFLMDLIKEVGYFVKHTQFLSLALFLLFYLPYHGILFLKNYL